MDDVTSPPATDTVDSVRRGIDDLDTAMLALLSQRQLLVDRLRALKTPDDGLPIRPAREANLLRRLVGQAPGALEREFVVEVWRAIIGAALRRQRVVDIYVGGGRGDPTRMFDIARRHFGARARIQHVGEPQTALMRVLDAPASCVAVTPWPAAPGVGGWWPALSENRFRDLHVIAGLPLLGGGEENPEACVFAASKPEAAGEDITMLLAFDPHHRVQRALNELGLDGKEVARAEPRVLIRIQGFLGIDDPRAAALTQFGLESVRVLGAYARL